MFPGVRERVYLKGCIMVMYLYVFMSCWWGGKLQRKFYVHIIRVGMRVAQKCIFMHKGEERKGSGGGGGGGGCKSQQ